MNSRELTCDEMREHLFSKYISFNEILVRSKINVN